MTYHFPATPCSGRDCFYFGNTYNAFALWSFTTPQWRNREIPRRERCEMLLSCSDKVSNIAISPSSLKNCYKPISKIAPIYSVKTVSSSPWQCKLLGWIMPVSFRGVYQGGSITQRPKSVDGPVPPLVSPSAARSWCAAIQQPAAIAQDTRWCPVTLLHGNTGGFTTPVKPRRGGLVIATQPKRRKPLTEPDFFLPCESWNLMCPFPLMNW